MIYFIQGIVTRKIKIGFSKNPSTRLSRLQTGSPDELVIIGVAIGDMSIEKILHDKFSESHSHGEWFNDCEKIREFIRIYCHTDSVELSVYMNEVALAGGTVRALTPLDKVEIMVMQNSLIERLNRCLSKF
jgi:hypothetical protein